MVKIMIWNIRGLNSPVKHHEIWREVRELLPDAVCLQKMHLKSSETHPMKLRLSSTQYFAATNTKQGGALTGLHKDFHFEELKVIRDTLEGLYIYLEGQHLGLGSIFLTFISKQWPGTISTQPSD